MDLIERLKKIAETVEIPESELILDEARFFMREHRGHGYFQIQLGYDKGILESIQLQCFAMSLPIDEMNRCPHYNKETPVEYCTSFVYSNLKDSLEIKLQRERREEILRKNSRHFEK
ncbi:MAG: hypothetical protein Q8P79_01065 [Nanoarchaeota archaeon]|nr:hypothetical protein [Nanoarchaeota archaeon]